MSEFGSPAYSVEELIAELGATYLCLYTRILEREIDSSAAYINSWLEQLKNDKRLIFSASGQAQKAVDYILGRKNNEAKDELEESKDESVVS